MHTLILRNKPRKSPRGERYTIVVVGDSQIKTTVQKSIQELDQHPAHDAQRSLIDMLGLIERHNFQIRHTEHAYTEENLETWLFVLQG